LKSVLETGSSCGPPRESHPRRERHGHQELRGDHKGIRNFRANKVITPPLPNKKV
jgi:hypothetical protein